MIINLISGPRNISTALMYSFAQRTDTKVIDEPYYAFYLAKTGIDHPGKEEILGTMPHNADEVLYDIRELEKSNQVVFVKNMAHHHIMKDLSFIDDWVNVFLIRDPGQLITSFAKVIPNPEMKDIGLKKSYELYEYLISKKLKTIVIDSNEILKSPKKVLTNLCGQIGIEFHEGMLKWNQGPISEDGIWAKHWYENVHNSTGFSKQTQKPRIMPDHLKPLYKESLIYYNKLFRNSIKYVAEI